MNLTEETLFFPILTRRTKYTTKSTGEYYKDYSRYRQEIREDCLGRCVYCDRHENEIGGKEEMESDHFRPKDKYPELNVPRNLVWSCHKCNNLKRGDWPAFGTNKTFVDKIGFIDPFQENRQDYFEILEDGQIRSLQNPATYIINRLLLDRDGLRIQRQKRNFWFQELKQFIGYANELETSLKEGIVPDDLKDIFLRNKAIFEKQISKIQESYLDFRLY